MYNDPSDKDYFLLTHLHLNFSPVKRSSDRHAHQNYHQFLADKMQ